MGELNSAEIALTGVFTLLVITDIIGNSIVCFVILKKRFKVQFCQGKTAMDYLLVNLATPISYSLYLSYLGTL